MNVPLDGINNNKAKLRESLITISRFHLTATRNGESAQWPLYNDSLPGRGWAGQM